MPLSTSTTPTVTPKKGEDWVNLPINASLIIQPTKTTQAINGLDYTQYPAIVMNCVGDGEVVWIYDEGDEATRDADYTTLLTEIC